MQPHYSGENIISVERKYIDVPLSTITATALQSPLNIRQSQPVQELGTRLLEMAKKGDAEGVRDLMNRGAPFSTDWLGTSPLHFAAQYNHLEIVEMLLKAGISRDARNKVERTPLHVAAQEGNTEVVKFLISYGADVDCRDMLKMTPLHWAAENGQAETVKLLLNFGADPLVLNKFDKTPHNIAHDNNRLDIVVMLQEAATLDPVSRKVLRTQGLESIIDNNLFNSIQQTSQSDISNNEEIANESQTASSTLQMLQEHGITMLPVDDSSIVASAVQSGQTVVLTEAGKMALNHTKLNPATPGAGIVKRLPVTSKHVKTTSTQKLLVDGRKLIRVQPEELINMTREKKVIIHTGDKKLGRPGQIIFSKPLRQVTNVCKFVDVQNKKVTSSEFLNKIIKTDSKSDEVQDRERDLRDFEEITKQLEEARRQAEMYREQLLLKEKEAEQYRLQLESLVNGK